MAIKQMRNFLSSQSASGIVLFIAAIIALIISNSPWAHVYHSLLASHLSLHIFSFTEETPLLTWINKGLMTLFFMLVGLELKREFSEGELSKRSQIVLPGVAALGGMIVPALFYTAINFYDSIYAKGWAIPVATDIAFALGVLSFFGKRVPLGLKMFLLALAIFDDLGAILIIAIFRPNELSLQSFFFTAVLIIILQIMNNMNVKRLLPYLIVGLLLWVSVLKSGIHATISGVILALMIPQKTAKPFEEFLHPWVAFVIMPIFAFANVGITIDGLNFYDFTHPITLGVIAGLFLGKQLGVFGSAWLLIKAGYAKLPERTSWLALYGVAILCGIGFTMSLFLGTLAFEEDGASYLTAVRLGVLIGSMLAGIFGAFVLNYALKEP